MVFSWCKHFFSILMLVFCVFVSLNAQQISGIVTNNKGKPLPFASIKFCNSKQGLVTNLNGSFSFEQKKITCIEVGYSGFQSKTVSLNSKDSVLEIVLQEKLEGLDEVVVTSSSKNKLKRILNATVENRKNNNPDLYNEYQCNIYYKMTVAIDFPDSLSNNDTTIATKKMKAMMKNQHLLVTETFSKRSWKKPEQLQEKVIATKVSGFKTPLFINLVTNILPFHAYNDFLVLNGKDYHSPISKGLFQRYDFKLVNELLMNDDTIWIINFKPKNINSELSGSLYINSKNFALTKLLATANDTVLKRVITLEQQYAKVNDKWFPSQLNYVLKMNMPDSKDNSIIYLNGKSMIDSVTYDLPKTFRFNKRHSVLLEDSAEMKTDSSWKALRPVQLDKKERQTFVFMDSLSEKYHLDRMVTWAGKIAEGKIPIGAFDVNLNRFFTFNPYEKNRFGMGLQTNEKWNKLFSVGAWFGYGTRDKAWKYGGFVELYADKYKEFIVRASYDKDLVSPGTLQINKDLNKNYLRQFLLTKADIAEEYRFSIEKRIGYLTAILNINHQQITPTYNYGLESANHQLFTQFTANEIGLNTRYAYKETTAPAFGKYFSTGTKYPILYTNIGFGKIDETKASYSKLITAVSWQKHFNRWGNDHFLVIAGKVWSNNSLPFNKLFAANGFAANNNALYIFGGMQTIQPFEYYTDQFVNFYLKHDFDFKLYNLQFKKNVFSSVPYFSLAYSGLVGSLNNSSVHKNVVFSVPENVYHEAGILLNSILRVKYLNFNYFTLNLGYFKHLNGSNNASSRFTFGLGIDL